MAFKFRTGFKKLVPSWLYNGEGELVLYSLNLILDAFWTRIRAGHESQYPSRAGTSALALIGRDREIPRGRTETNEHYAQRLIAWRFPRGHRVRGSAFAALEQISEYFGGVRCWSIDQNGNRHDRAVDGTETFQYGFAWNWDGAPTTPNWARFWFVIDGSTAVPPFTKHPTLDDPLLWDGGTLDQAVADGFQLDVLGASHQDTDAIQRLFEGRTWHPAGTLPEWLVVSFDGADPVPDGNWGNNAGRDPAFGYWKL